MHNKPRLIVSCFASALVGGIVATVLAEKDEVSAQQTSVSQQQATTIQSNCVRCPWQYKYCAGPAGAAIQIAPSGSTGVLHSVLNTNTVIEVWEGAPNIGVRVLRVPSSQPQPLIDLQFTNGLFVLMGTSGEATILYKLDSQLGTSPEK